MCLKLVHEEASNGQTSEVKQKLETITSQTLIDISSNKLCALQ